LRSGFATAASPDRWVYGASCIIAIDLDDNRVEQAKSFRATDAVNSGRTDWRDAVLAMTDGLGTDVAIKAGRRASDLRDRDRAHPPRRDGGEVGVHGKVGAEGI
jgi:alcohol dehydrogenase